MVGGDSFPVSQLLDKHDLVAIVSGRDAQCAGVTSHDPVAERTQRSFPSNPDRRTTRIAGGNPGDTTGSIGTGDNIRVVY